MSQQKEKISEAGQLNLLESAVGRQALEAASQFANAELYRVADRRGVPHKLSYLPAELEKLGVQAVTMNSIDTYHRLNSVPASRSELDCREYPKLGEIMEVPAEIEQEVAQHEQAYITQREQATA